MKSRILWIRRCADMPTSRLEPDLRDLSDLERGRAYEALEMASEPRLSVVMSRVVRAAELCGLIRTLEDAPSN